LTKHHRRSLCTAHFGPECLGCRTNQGLLPGRLVLPHCAAARLEEGRCRRRPSRPDDRLAHYCRRHRLSGARRRPFRPTQPRANRAQAIAPAGAHRLRSHFGPPPMCRRTASPLRSGSACLPKVRPLASTALHSCHSAQCPTQLLSRICFRRTHLQNSPQNTLTMLADHAGRDFERIGDGKKRMPLEFTQVIREIRHASAGPSIFG